MRAGTPAAQLAFALHRARSPMRAARLTFVLLLGCVLAVWSAALAAQAPTDAAAALRARYAELQDRLRDNAFGLALYVDSQQLPQRLAGDLYGVINEPFATVRSALSDRCRPRPPSRSRSPDATLHSDTWIRTP